LKATAFTKQSTKTVQDGNHKMYKELINYFRVLDFKFWHTSTESSHPMYGMKEITYLSERYSLDLDKTLNAFREFIENEGRLIPVDLKPLFTIMNIIPVGTSECERGFSQMNLIETDIRSRLNVTTIADLLFIKLNGPPLELWQSRSYVLHWLKTHKSADISANRSIDDAGRAALEIDNAFYKYLN